MRLESTIQLDSTRQSRHQGTQKNAEVITDISTKFDVA